jgi:microcin C transport system substrate-binding protein
MITEFHTRPARQISLGQTANISLADCVFIVLVFVFCLGGATARSQPVTAAHALTMHGEPKYAANFKHFDYVNPQAPKGGEARLAEIGTFDNLNPYILKGVAAAGLSDLFDTLTVQSEDEAFSEYGLIAETITVPPDRSWVSYTLRPQARFSDGTPITVEDVIFSFNILKTQGHPFYRTYYANVKKAGKVGKNQVKFSFSSGNNRELPLIVGQLPVLSKAYWSTRDFTKTTLQAPLGSGPYEVTNVQPGRSITYRRNPDYWAAKLPVNVGRYNFDVMRYDYYRDATVALEAFKAGEYDFREENIAKDWATGYSGPALDHGLIIKVNIPHEQPTGMQGFVFNTRREIFKDSRVRRALAFAFDFEWANKNLFYGAYTRTNSYFSNSELASTGLPSTPELKILQPYRGRLPEEVFTQAYKAPTNENPSDLRRNLRQASRLLDQAGWRIQGGERVKQRTGQPMRFELLLVMPSFERVALPFKRNLKRLGIDMSVRTVDSAQYEQRVEDFDFDMVVMAQGQSLSPGNEQRDFWSSTRADIPGGRNLAGIKDPVVDELVEGVINASDRADLIQHTRALDRVLLGGHYVIPHWHLRQFRVAYWDKFGRPPISPKYALGFDTWWIDPAKQAALAKRRNVLDVQP